MKESMIVRIDASGNLKFIWDDALLPVFESGKGTIRRASCVEPTSEGTWTADLAPSGPLLGPFKTRKEALNAEVAWLKENVIGVWNEQRD